MSEHSCDSIWVLVYGLVVVSHRFRLGGGPEQTVGRVGLSDVLGWDGRNGVTLRESLLPNVSGTRYLERIPAGAENWEDFL